MAEFPAEAPRPVSTRARVPASEPLTSTERSTMPLVDLVMRQALDEEYVEVARRRRGEPPRRPGLLAAVAVLLFAVLVTISFQQTRSNADVVDAGRATLEERIGARREVVSAAQDRIVALRAENTSAEAAVELLDTTTEDTTRQVARLRSETGLAPSAGEGVQIVVGDAPDGLARHRVYDEDLALLVNGLWEAGASAVAVNGQRLTVLSAFRFSGGTIRVNDANLIPPYTVQALGDTRTLQADLAETTTGLSFQSRADEFGFTLDTQNVASLSLPAAPERLLTLRSASLARPTSLPLAEGPPSGRNAP